MTDPRHTMRSFRLHRPPCPACHSNQTRVVRSPGNITRLFAATVWAVLNGTVWHFGYRYVCRSCGRTFDVPADMEAENQTERDERNGEFLSTHHPDAGTPAPPQGPA